MSDLKDLTNDELKRISEELRQGHTIESGLLARWRMKRRAKINQEATKEMTSALVRNITAAALEDSDQRILQQRSLNAAKAETETQEEALKQARIQAERDELEFKAIERVVNRALMMRAVKIGLDLPTYLEVMKTKLIQPGNSEMDHMMTQVKAGLASEEFRAHMAIDLLREEVSGLYMRRKIIEDTETDPKVRKKKLKDIDDQIKAYKGDKEQRESGLVQGGERRQELPGGDQDTPPDARLRDEDDTE
jgi:hypothetical protein